MPDIRKVGIISGLMSECVNMGSMKRGMQKKQDQTSPSYEDNPWALTPKLVFITGRITSDNLDSLVEITQKKQQENRILFPGVSLVHLQESPSW